MQPASRRTIEKTEVCAVVKKLQDAAEAREWEVEAAVEKLQAARDKAEDAVKSAADVCDAHAPASLPQLLDGGVATGAHGERAGWGEGKGRGARRVVHGVWVRV